MESSLFGWGGGGWGFNIRGFPESPFPTRISRKCNKQKLNMEFILQVRHNISYFLQNLSYSGNKYHFQSIDSDIH